MGVPAAIRVSFGPSVMTWKTWALLFLALAAGALASYAVKSAFFVEKDKPVDENLDLSGPREPILVANGFIAAGSEINASNVRLEMTLERDLPRDGVYAFSDAAGRKTLRDYADGEPISFYDVDDYDETADPEVAYVPPGFSVVPIEICSATKINGSRNYLKSTKLDKMVKPGDLIDISVVKEVPAESTTSRRRRLVAAPIVSGAEVFSVVDSSRIGSEGVVRESILSALLDADQLEAMKKGSEEGKIRIVLRDPDDESATEGLDYEEAFNQDNEGFVASNAKDDAQQAQEEPAPVSMNEGFVMDEDEEDDDFFEEQAVNPDETSSGIPEKEDLDNARAPESDSDLSVRIPEKEIASLGEIAEIEEPREQVSEPDFSFRSRPSARNNYELESLKTGDGDVELEPTASSEETTVRANVVDRSVPERSVKLRSPFVTINKSASRARSRR